MRTQVDYHFVPNVRPFRMMVHRLCNQRYAGHVAERGDEVLALKGAVQFAVDQAPALGQIHASLNLWFAELFDGHGSLRREAAETLCLQNEGSAIRAKTKLAAHGVLHCRGGR